MITPPRAAACLLLLAAVTFAACREAPSPPNPDAGAARDAGDADAGGHACGATGPACASDEYCAYTPALCGKGKRAGTCRPRPVDCHEPSAPVCGCDGNVAASECAAHAAGVDLAVNGGCHASVPGFVACGPRFCDARRSYCEIVLSDVFELPTDYTCKPLPPACVPEGDVARGCDCFPAGTRCRSFCGHLPAGGTEGFHLTCRL